MWCVVFHHSSSLLIVEVVVIEMMHCSFCCVVFTSHCINSTSHHITSHYISCSKPRVVATATTGGMRNARMEIYFRDQVACSNFRHRVCCYCYYWCCSVCCLWLIPLMTTQHNTTQHNTTYTIQRGTAQHPQCQQLRLDLNVTLFTTTLNNNPKQQQQPIIPTSWTNLSI